MRQSRLLSLAFISMGLLSIFCGTGLPTLADDDAPKGLNKSGMDFRKVDFTKQGEDLRNFNGSDSNFTEARFNGMNLTGAKFRDANVEYTRFDECILNKADFRDALLEGAAFRKAKMIEVNMEGCRKFDASNVESLRRAKLKKAHVKGSLENADLRDADLRGTNLSGVHYFPGAKFKNAVYSDETIFMTGFDPVGEGMIKKGLNEDLSDEGDAKKK